MVRFSTILFSRLILVVIYTALLAADTAWNKSDGCLIPMNLFVVHVLKIPLHLLLFIDTVITQIIIAKLVVLLNDLTCQISVLVIPLNVNLIAFLPLIELPHPCDSVTL